MNRPSIFRLVLAHLLVSGALVAASGTAQANAPVQKSCQLHSPENKIKHVDNVHLRRDNLNVPSDLEKMPNLLNFLLANGTASGNHFTPLIHGNPAPTDATTRQMEHDINAIKVLNPITNRFDKLSARLADQAEMKLLHMVTSIPDRTPTFTMFGNADYFNETANASQGQGTDCSHAPPCVFEALALLGTTVTSRLISPAPGSAWLALACKN